MQRNPIVLRSGIIAGCLASVLPGLVAAEAEKPPAGPPPLKALLVTGGCSHDYPARQKILTAGIRERVRRPIEWVVRMQGLRESDERIPLFESSEWATGYDIVVHDHCFPRVRDAAYIERILAPHRAGVPAVLLHGTMMSFQTGDDRWFQFTGAHIRGHEPEAPVSIIPLKTGEGLLLPGLPWKIPMEELYRVDTLVSGAVVLSEASDPDGKRHPTAWFHRYGADRSRVFATSLGNDTSIVSDPRYLDLVSRGFLWALGEDDENGFKVVPESEVRAALPTQSTQILPKPGRNALRDVKPTGFAWGSVVAPEDLVPTIDGDPASAWTAGKPGPGVWEAEMPDTRSLAAVVVLWKGEPPLLARLEGSADGETWGELFRWDGPGKSAEISLARFPSQKLRKLRLSVERMRPGGVMALREVAAYESAEKVPAAILERVPAPEPSEGDPQSAEPAPGPAPIITDHGEVKVAGRIGELVPMGTGGLFLSFYPEGRDSGQVVCLELIGGAIEVRPYLDGIGPSTRIAWDGEWLYTLSGRRLDRVRCALGPGPADERQRLGTLFALPETGAPEEASIGRMQLGDDGWLWAEIRSLAPGEVLGVNGQKLLWPISGRIRFSRRGEGLSVEPLAQHAAVTDPQGIVGEILARADDGPRSWTLVRQGDQIRLIRLSTPGSKTPSLPAASWDEVSSTALLEFLKTAEETGAPIAAREAALEVGRRHGIRFPAEWWATEVSEVRASLLVLATRRERENRTRPFEALLAGTDDPDFQSAAFLALGDQRLAGDPGSFAALGQITVPSVSAAIFDALRRSGSRIEGDEAVAMALSGHTDARLSASARAFLFSRRAVEPAYRALEGDREQDWPVALGLLSQIGGPGIINRLMGYADQTRKPGLRRAILATLTKHLQVADGVKSPDRGEVILRYLEARLLDHRTDRFALLRDMEEAGFKISSSEVLARLLRDGEGLEAFAIQGMLGANVDLDAGTLERLDGISLDESHDATLRIEALALLAEHAPGTRYREIFGRIAAAPTSRGNVEAVRVAETHWRQRPDHWENRDWLIGQSVSGNAATRTLASRTLLQALSRDQGSREDRTQILARCFGSGAPADPDIDAKIAEDLAALLRDARDRIRLVVDETEAGAVGGMPPEMTRLLRSEPPPDLPGKDLFEPEELRHLAASRVGDPALGKRWFRSLGCIDCHNPHGEGPAYGPDLAASAGRVSTLDLLEAIAWPERKIGQGFSHQTTRLSAGFSASVWTMKVLEGRPTLWMDFAGNRVSVAATRPSNPAPASESPCGGATKMSRKELADLLEFIKNLAI